MSPESAFCSAHRNGSQDQFGKQGKIAQSFMNSALSVLVGCLVI